MRAFRIGQRFTLSENAIENYGEEYRDIVFHVRQWFDHYTPEDYWLSNNGKDLDPHGHPGFDGQVEGDCLYEAVEDNCPGALYDYEMEAIHDNTRR